MSRSRRASRTTFALLAIAAVAGLGIYLAKTQTATAVATTGGGTLLAHEPGPALAAPEALPGQTTLLRQGVPTTGPSTRSGTQSSTRPASVLDTSPLSSPQAEALFREATAKRDAGDLVTARNLVNDALQGGRLEPGDVDDAKAFVGALNDKIIFGTQKFAADAFNKEWKVEPGTALARLCKRFDVTAELLCKVNGLSRPDRLRAGVTIKAIQGPFHLVVSKGKFEADVYLGAAGGAGSMYLKTLRVGLGSDGSTPTGTWRVETGKVVNPVYYSSRGEGVVAADDPKNPLGERWLPLTGIEGDAVGKESFGIHGTIEPDSIGKNMSQGCIRLAGDDINLLYDLLVEGKSIVKVVD